MVAENLYEYNGLTFGDELYRLITVEGGDSPDVRSEVISRSIKDGSWTFGEFSAERVWRFSGYIVEPDPEILTARQMELRRAFAKQPENFPLRFKWPGVPEMRSYCIPTRKHFPLTVEAKQVGLMEWVVELLAGDPLLYSNEEHELVGEGNAVNAGLEATPPLIIVEGPASDPRVANATTGEFVEWIGDVASGEELEFDAQNQTVKLDGVSVYGDFNFTDSVWWYLQPGDNDIEVTDGDLVVRWRDAWI